MAARVERRGRGLPIVQDKRPDVRPGSRKSHPPKARSGVSTRKGLKAVVTSMFYTSAAKPLLKLISLIQDSYSSTDLQWVILTRHIPASRSAPAGVCVKGVTFACV